MKKGSMKSPLCLWFLFLAQEGQNDFCTFDTGINSSQQSGDSKNTDTDLREVDTRGQFGVIPSYSTFGCESICRDNRSECYNSENFIACLFEHDETSTLFDET
eukprot:GDKJ01052647.1.p1 GENE.GDKJ01052647.1~~GDKJ01052647.1.p1  ORF type:complete len:103 (+),score=7.64 GDKJ01052647.1:3-311(+)